MTISTSVKSPTNKHALWLECFIIFGLGPLVLYVYREYLYSVLLPLLVAVAFLCLVVLLKDNSFKRFRLVNKESAVVWLPSILKMFSGLIFITSLLFYLYEPEYFFYMPLNDTTTWLLILVAYPLFSALPQEIIFRTFLFHRYKLILPNQEHRIWLSSLSFGYAHIFYANWLAVALSIFAGYIFCKTYAQSRSTVLVAIEHSLWGVWIFSLGLGVYFDTSYIQ